ncbi:c-type cytochrome [Aureibacter tunicatorum]|uniref:Mono/diheme cytochrome c family protein n=1 Tax=Aureibacter tunicatorum TaxID=866807 RepID=A0AAE3XRV0_9BACT|nr:c-type cytochrome [Aureibacter tunicatorum]MDR6241608.1 mono/diheme cytochrome c family protein [Aureibacter tunicatorum]
MTNFEKKSLPPLSTVQIALSDDSKLAYFANKTSQSVIAYNISDWSIEKEWNFDMPVTGICLNDNKAYITTSYEMGWLQIIDLRSGEIINKIKLGVGAKAPLLSSDGNKLFVCNQFENNISIIRLDENMKETKVSVIREPFSSDISKDGKYLFVTNFLPATRADIDTVTASVSIIDIDKSEKIKDISLSNGSNALRSIKITPDGKYAMIIHNLGRHQVPTSQLEQGWMNTSAVSIIDVDKQSFVASILLDEPEYGAAGSWSVDFKDNIMAVSHSGTHDISLINYQEFIDKLNNTPDKETLSYDLTFLNDIRERRKISGNGPRLLTFNKGKILVPTYFSDTLNIIDPLDKHNDYSLAINKGWKESDARMGERYFNDAQYCFQAWQSCNGCHPGDARTDGMNWDLLNDGIGNPKNVKSLLYAHATPPSMISGIRSDAETAVRAGFQHIQFSTIDENQAKAVDAYLKSLKPQPSPFLVDGKLSESALKGKQIFENSSCRHCHSGEYFTDNKMHKIGRIEFEEGWNTPTLKEVWRTAPYGHDGKSYTLKEFLKNEKHGIGDNMTDEDLECLINYVLTL